MTDTTARLTAFLGALAILISGADITYIIGGGLFMLTVAAILLVGIYVLRPIVLTQSNNQWGIRLAIITLFGGVVAGTSFIQQLTSIIPEPLSRILGLRMQFAISPTEHTIIVITTALFVSRQLWFSNKNQSSLIPTHPPGNQKSSRNNHIENSATNFLYT